MIGDCAGRRAFDEFVAARSPAFIRLAYLLTAGDQHAAEDLLQTSLANTALKWHKIEDPEAYLRQVMYRQQISWWRRRREYAVAELPERPAADTTHDVELKIMMQDALGRLTSKQRAVLVLRYFEDLSESTVAATLGCSIGTVRSTAHRALARLLRLCPELHDLYARSTATHGKER
ncbi:RNA polymerase sigma-70 factor (sigma-E family) [Nonomuraea polychroma]|uniref:RNA polymerase sigma-70 factor (Sigma-E family) n=1 Tax=Nonomuraea polychroma TaxID=46176 RepID=A0A438MKQ6_9ACTN|nr:SigE family RNA polymerase sigma factor [Nonomuraea polychroma]RVX46292.1 RNA polymerase sigma-70 factor (sigma-E family) [Nonomuraea polychroma]